MGSTAWTILTALVLLRAPMPPLSFQGSPSRSAPVRPSAVIATHVENAVGFTHLVAGVIPANAAIARYLREFNLPDGLAQMVRQRAQARVAGRELTAQYDDPSQQPTPAESLEPMQS